MDENYPTLLYTSKGRSCSDLELEMTQEWLDHNLSVVRKYSKSIGIWTGNYWVNTDLENGYFRSERLDFMTDTVYPSNKSLAIDLMNGFIESKPLPFDMWLFRGIQLRESNYRNQSKGFISYSFSIIPTMHFASGDTLIITKIPKGSKVIYVPTEYSKPLRSTGLWTVCEFIIPPFTTQRTIDVVKWDKFFGLEERDPNKLLTQEERIKDVKNLFPNAGSEIPEHFMGVPNNIIITELVKINPLNETIDIINSLPTYDDDTLYEMDLPIDED